jgi:hypothetical protein
MSAAVRSALPGRFVEIASVFELRTLVTLRNGTWC